MMTSADSPDYEIGNRYGFSVLSKISFFLFLPAFSLLVVMLLILGGPFVILSFSSIVFPALPFLAFTIELYSRDRSEKVLRIIAWICALTPVLTAMAFYKSLGFWVYVLPVLSVLLLLLQKKFRLVVLILLCISVLLITLLWIGFILHFQ